MNTLLFSAYEIESNSNTTYLLSQKDERTPSFV